MAKTALISLALLGALTAPIAATAQQGVDWEGYTQCRDSCSEAFPGRERECERSCGEQYGVDFGDDQPPVTPGGNVGCRVGAFSIE